MVLNNVKLGIGFAVAVVIICTALYLFGQARATISASGEQAPGGEEPVLTGDNVRRYSTMGDIPLIDPVRTLRYGTKSEAGGCRTSQTMSVRPGYTMMHGRTIAMDFDTCEYIWEEGAVDEEHQEGLMEDDGLGKGSYTRQSERSPL